MPLAGVGEVPDPTAPRQVLHESIPVLHDVAGQRGYEAITLSGTSVTPLFVGKPVLSRGSSV
jgi:hypothetical protein